MAYLNGRLPSAALSNIAGGRLRRDAARAWNAMAAEAWSKHHFAMQVSDSYRVLGSPGDLNRGRWSQWAAWERYRRGGNLAAVPGTSNHGLGLAVDVPPPTRAMIDRIGAKYGFAKRWSDAPSESWHIKWKVGSYPAVKDVLPTLKRGQTGSSVIKLKKMLYAKGMRGFGSRYNPFFNQTTEDAVKRLQKRHGFSPDGVVGPKTWSLLA
jgi:peptidoglycan hydrolase-like protein with peptidoglycan-binding domain